MATALLLRATEEVLKLVVKVVFEVDFASSAFDRLGMLGLIMPRSRGSGPREPHPRDAALVVLAALLRRYPAVMDAAVS